MKKFKKFNCNPQKSYPCGQSCQTNAHKGNCNLGLSKEVSESLGDLKQWISSGQTKAFKTESYKIARAAEKNKKAWENEQKRKEQEKRESELPGQAKKSPTDALGIKVGTPGVGKFAKANSVFQSGLKNADEQRKKDAADAKAKAQDALKQAKPVNEDEDIFEKAKG